MISAQFAGQLGGFALDVRFEAPARGVTGIFGPSGSGKTTILRCIAGLTRMHTGRFTLNGQTWQDDTTFLPAHRRPVGYVFQDARLFAHLSAAGNLDYAIKRAGPDRIASHAEVVDLLGLDALLPRMPSTLSGGERQRVAIARAVLSQPELILMDEPLSALDRDARHDILPYVERLGRELAVPVLYVSHDLSEIERLADHLVLLERGGRVSASGSLQALLGDLELPLARGADAGAVLELAVEGHDTGYDLTICRVGALRIVVPGMIGAAGQVRRVRVAASDVSLVKGAAGQTSVLNVLPTRIVGVAPSGTAQMQVLLALESADTARLLSSITRKSWDSLGLSVGDAVTAQIKGMALADRH